MRVFAAIDLPSLLLRQVAAGMAELEKNVGRGRQLRWVAVENIHVTLKFLGEVEERQLDQFSACCAAVEWSPFELKLGGCGCFPSLARPRVFWQGFSAGIDEMRSLLARIEPCAAGIGVPREQRPYTPHLTLARVRRPKKPGEKLDFHRLRETADGLLPVGASFLVGEFFLYQSQLTPKGAIYRKLRTFAARKS